MPIRALLGGMLLIAADYGVWEWAVGTGHGTVAIGAGLALPVLAIAVLAVGAACALSLLSRIAHHPAPGRAPPPRRPRTRLPIG